MKEIRVLLVEDRDIVRDSIRLNFLKSKEIKIEGEASDGREAIKKIREKQYDVVLMDINMPNMNGIESTKEIVNLQPNIKILANSFMISAESIYEMINAGAYGFISKGEPMSKYREAIREVASGTVFLSDEIGYDVYGKVLNYLKYSNGQELFSSY